MRHREAWSRWRWGLAAALSMAAVAFVPQVHLWATRGGAWQGQYASLQPDETAYSAYTNALVAGRTRLCDPYTGRDAELEAAGTESLFSIQFAPAYLLALPARLFNLSASTAFIVLSPLAAFAATLALFWLLLSLTRDARFAAAAALAVLCLGGVATGHKLLNLFAGVEISHTPMPFLRRYVPAAPLPVFFAFAALVLAALTNMRRRVRHAAAALAAVAFAALVYSYFYLWTAAAAWLALLAPLWLAARAGGGLRALKTFALLAALASAALGPYALLLSRRPPALDAAQGLLATRAPDLLQVSEAAGVLVLFALATFARRGRIEWGEPAVVFAAAFSLLPLAVFNQQIVTSRSLQPLHYELFVTNYCWLVASALAAWLIRRGHTTADASVQSSETGRRQPSETAPQFFTAPEVFSSRLLASVALVAFGLGAFESVAATRITARRNLLLDEARPPLLRLAEIARAGADAQNGGPHGEGRGARDTNAAREIVFYADFRQADLAPTVTPHAVLWALHTFSFSGASREEERERLYQQLYFSGFDEQDFLRMLEQRTFLLSAVFGWTRALEGWRAHQPPISPEEMLGEQRAYADYVSAFTRERAARFPLSFAVFPAGREHELSNLDRFYERDAGERHGDFILYRVKLRP